MRTSLHAIAACIALIGTYAMAGVHPALAKKISQDQVIDSCVHDVSDCYRNCGTGSRDCEAQCNVSYKHCMSSGGIFIDPRRTVTDPGKPPRRHRYPVKTHIKPPKHHRHPVNLGGARAPSAGAKHWGSGHSSGTIMRGSKSQPMMHASHHGSKH